MKNYTSHVLIALCLTAFSGCSLNDSGADSMKDKLIAMENARINAGLNKLGIGKEYEIVIADERDIVEQTAVEILQRFFRQVSLDLSVVRESEAASEKRIILGCCNNLETIKKMCDSGDIQISDVSVEDDGFHLKKADNNIVIAGANPRGVLYGVYALEDFIRAGGDKVLDIKRVPYFRKRGSGVHYSFNPYVNLFTEDFPEEKAEYLSRMGINQLTDQGVGGYMHELVKSDVFTFEIAPKDDYPRKVKAMSALCKKYGIDQYLWLSVPDIAADLEKYPEEALGMVKRPWGGDKDGLERTLCVNSPIVKEHLRNMMRKIVREYPDVKGIQLYNMDGGAWLCTPELCSRCKIICTDSPPNEFTPWETQAILVTLLAESAHEVNPGFEIKFWGAVHYHGEQFDKMIHAAQGYGSLLSSWNASDRSVFVPDSAKPDPAFLISQNVCKERAIPFHMIFEYNNLESTPKSLPFPFHVCDALKKFKSWGVKNLTEIYGMVPEHNSINAMVVKEFQNNPDLDTEQILEELSLLQFGKKSGKLMYQAWEEMREAFDVWDYKQFCHLDGSQHILSLGTAVASQVSILPDIVKIYNHNFQILTNVEPWRAEEYQKYKEKEFLDNMIVMNTHLSKAAEYAKKAITVASKNEYIGRSYYNRMNNRPTCKEFAELNYAPIAIADAICSQRCNMIRAYHLLTEMEASRNAGDEEMANTKEKLYFDLIIEDIGVQERFYKLLSGFAEMQPCYLRTSLTEMEIHDLLAITEKKIGKYKEFLGQK